MDSKICKRWVDSF